MEAKDWKETIIKLKAVPKQIFKNQKDTRDTKLAYLAGWKDGTEAQDKISFKAGERKVVEWVNKEAKSSEIGNIYYILKPVWQKFLKSEGIE